MMCRNWLRGFGGAEVKSSATSFAPGFGKPRNRLRPKYGEEYGWKYVRSFYAEGPARTRAVSMSSERRSKEAK